MQDKAVVQVTHLRKAYGPLVAVDDVSLQVYAGEVFGMVGPNGAGKTTTIECVEGLRTADTGQVLVLGLDPRRDGQALRARIGMQLQQSALPERLKVWEALDLYASLYPRHADLPRLLDELGLADKRNAFFANLSGGQKQRLFIALALVNDPELVFLDELTTGLDPQARRATWDLVRGVRARGKTIFLTTHYMEEAEQLCDRVAVMDHGRLVALDSPEALVRGLDVENRVVFTVEGAPELQELRALPGVTRVEATGARVVVSGRGERLAIDVLQALLASRIRFRDLRTEQANLEDVFLSLTGREMQE
jgi:ABC-2 type transport system ATP-binding protein